MKIHPLITTTDDLTDLVTRLSTHDFVAVDTEFMRENTYWPDLCLIQIASPDEAAAKADRFRVERRFFAFSIVYLTLHFALLLVEAALRALELVPAGWPVLF